MKIYCLLRSLIVTFIVIIRTCSSHTKSMDHSLQSDFYTAFERVDGNREHKVIFALNQRNMDILERKLMDVSNPKSPNYGKYLTSAEVASLTANLEGGEVLLKYLDRPQVSILKRTLYDEFVIASAPINVWEDIFATEFLYYYHTQNPDRVVPLASHYTLDAQISEHVSVVLGVIHLPMEPSPPPPVIKSNQATVSNQVTPDLLNSFYHIFTNAGSIEATQSIFSAVGQYFSSEDLAAFQSYFGIPNDPVDADPNNRNNHAQCVANPDDCAESNLDLQYVKAVARDSFTKIIYADDFDNWIVETASEEHPAYVHSISYCTQESYFQGDSSYVNLFNQQAIKLGTMGVTVVVSSGDDGASGFRVRMGDIACRYDAGFPASSPYVVSVGATQNIEYGTAEIACSSSTSGLITSGGGFSALQPALSHQAAAIAGYFQQVSEQPVSGYNSNGRGYPDVSLAGSRYFVLIGTFIYSVYGTSASAPAFAGMVTLVNAARIRVGQPTVGFLNPTLYASGGSFANDITSGDNKCNEVSCCSQGFRTTSGWDPVTGFGSVDFRKFYNLFMDINITTSSPTLSPSKTPFTFKPSSRLPTMLPTRAPLSPRPTPPPSIPPSRSPSVQPTVSPTRSPSMSPSYRPTPSPSVTPSRNPLAPTSPPSMRPTVTPTSRPSSQPTSSPSTRPSKTPTTVPSKPTRTPTSSPSMRPTVTPTSRPSSQPTSSPSTRPSATPTTVPSKPTRTPTLPPSMRPTVTPTDRPSRQPTSSPSTRPSKTPTTVPSKPTRTPTSSPSMRPTVTPTSRPSSQPTSSPSTRPSATPTTVPSKPTRTPTLPPSMRPTVTPTDRPSRQPTSSPSTRPSKTPTTVPSKPTRTPTTAPTKPTRTPTASPTMRPTTLIPSRQPSRTPTSPTIRPSTNHPSTNHPSVEPSELPTVLPTAEPTTQNSVEPSLQPIEPI